jgi:rfaE bifunctional protein kinase chain/domain
MFTTEMVNRLFASFDGTRVLVIGDVMLDTYVWGSVNRISPEAPVPIVAVEKREVRLGGAANVALNLKSMGAEPVLCSVVGQDARGDEFGKLLQKDNLSTTGIIKSADRKTTTKFRIIGNNTQLLRVDDETTTSLLPTEKEKLKLKISNILDEESIRIIILQDYDKGVLDKEIIEFTVDLASSKNIPLAVDPKQKNFLFYKNVTLFKPNLKEINEGLNLAITGENQQQVEAAVTQLQTSLNADIIMNTLSENGVFIRWKENDSYKSSHLNAHIRNIADVSGAGDTVISVAALCLAEGLNPEDLTAVANLAGGLVCEEVGVVPIDKNKLHDEVVKTLTF